jgi:TolB-like protein/Tol biopolymer transport system component/Flp pilus assembly protein TadD
MSSDVSSIYYQDNLNSSNPSNDGVYRFENFRLDSAHLMLYENETPITLAPKVIETLVALVERGGQVISKEELMERLWHDSFVEESNLTQNIYLLRKMLGNNFAGKPMIETFRRRGYRFTGELEKNEEIKKLSESKIQNEKSDNSADDIFDSLAVLPLRNESTSETAEYLSDGITESIINRLSQITKLRVVARNTVFQYKNKEILPQEIGRKLGVRAVLTGRILQYGDRLIVRTELVETTEGWQIWGEQHERRATDVLELQETIAREISEHLHLKLSGEERKRLTMRYTESSEAYNLFVKGRYHLNKRLTGNIKQSAACFQQAIDVDPSFAPAYVGLADCFPLLSLYGALTPREAYPKSKAAAEKALEIDNSLTKAYNSLGVVKLFYEWDWTGAETAFKRAIELNPGYPDAHLRYGMFLTATARFEEAETEFARAQELDPLSLITKTIGGYPFYYSRQFDEAERCFAEVTTSDENYSMAHFRLGLNYAQQGRFTDAINELKISLSLSDDRDTIAALGYVQGLAGNPSEAKSALAELDKREKDGFVTSYNRVLINLGLRNHTAALDWLEKAYAERSYWLIYLKLDPALDALRETPRFIDLQKKIFGEINEAKKELYVVPSLKTLVAKKNAPLADSKKSSFAKMAIAATLLFSAIVFAAYLFNSETRKTQNQSAAGNLKRTRLTADLNVSSASFTPDGKSLIYSLREKESGSIWLKDLAIGSATQILPTISGNYYDVKISRDNFIYYSTERPNSPNRTLIRVPVSGGVEQIIAADLLSPFAFSPDEKQIVFVRNQGELVIAARDGSESRILAKRTDKKWFESWESRLSWSPDGNSIVICGGRHEKSKSIRELIEVNIADGSEKIIPTPTDWNYIDDAVWLADKSAVFVTARETMTSPFQIWRVAYPNGETVRVTNDTNNYADLNLSPDSRRLVIIANSLNLNLWLAPFEDTSKAKQITFGNAATDGFWGMTFAPDGKIIYTSPRDGNFDLWQINSDGGEQKQLTKNAGNWNGRPVITPDRRFIVFTSTRSGTKQIWRTDADGGNPKQLTEEFWADEPSVSPDGEQIYFSVSKDGKSYISKISMDGGKSSQISPPTHNFFLPVISSDGKFVFCRFYDWNSNTPWKTGILNAENGALIKIFGFYTSGTAVWTKDSNSIIYSLPADANLWKISIGSDSNPQQITDFESGVIRAFAISPDFGQIVISRGSISNEAVLLENF